MSSGGSVGPNATAASPPGRDAAGAWPRAGRAGGAGAGVGGGAGWSADSLRGSAFGASSRCGQLAVSVVIVSRPLAQLLFPQESNYVGKTFYFGSIEKPKPVQVIGVVDGFNQSRMIASNAFNLSAVTIVAILFVLITIPQARFVDRLLERDQARMRAAS